MSDLRTVTDVELEAECDKRHREREIAKRIEEVERNQARALREYKDRPSLPVLGRAYGSPFRDTKGESHDHNLAKVHISGNMGRDYRSYLSFDVPSAVNTYFHNIWGDQYEREFQKGLEGYVRNFVESRLKDPVIIISLMCLSSPSIPYGFRDIEDEWITEADSIARESWEAAVIENLGRFTDDELRQAGVDLINSGETAHAQIACVTRVLLSRGAKVPFLHWKNYYYGPDREELVPKEE